MLCWIPLKVSYSKIVLLPLSHREREHAILPYVGSVGWGMCTIVLWLPYVGSVEGGMCTIVPWLIGPSMTMQARPELAMLPGDKGRR